MLKKQNKKDPFVFGRIQKLKGKKSVKDDYHQNVLFIPIIFSYSFHHLEGEWKKEATI